MDGDQVRIRSPGSRSSARSRQAAIRGAPVELAVAPVASSCRRRAAGRARRGRRSGSTARVEQVEQGRHRGHDAVRAPVPTDRRRRLTPRRCVRRAERAAASIGRGRDRAVGCRRLDADASRSCSSSARSTVDDPRRVHGPGPGGRLAIYYRELRRRGWLGGPIVWISLAAVLGGRDRARVDHRVGAPRGLRRARRPAVQRGHRAQRQEHPRRARRRLHRDRRSTKRAFGYTRSTGDCYLLAIPVATVIGRIGCFLSELPLGTPTTCRGASRSARRRRRRSRGAPAATCRCTPRCSTRSPSTSSRSP